MSLLQIIADPLGTIRSHSHQHHHPVLLGMNETPLLFDHHQHPDEEDDLLYLWKVPRHMRRLLLSPYQYHRDHRHNKSLGKANKAIKIDKDHFQVNIDVQQFSPDEITVKATGNNTITVEGKHDEKPDEHGSISRHFVRRYVLPKGHDIEKVESRLSSDGVLTITAPKISSKKKPEEREIPVLQTCKPSIAAAADSSAVENTAGKESEKMDTK